MQSFNLASTKAERDTYRLRVIRVVHMADARWSTASALIESCAL
jgi:hypothetical protein